GGAGRGIGRPWRLLGQPPRAIGPPGNAPRGPRDICGARICRSRRAGELRGEPDGCLSPGRRLYRPRPQGREARGPAGSAGDQVRTGDQRRDRPDTRPDRARQATGSRRRGDRVKRREFIMLLGGAAAAAWRLAARAQQPAMPTIGVLGVATASAWNPWVTAFIQRLRELGWIEGRTVAIEYRWADGRSERFPELAAEFVRLKVDVIVTAGGAVIARSRPRR